MARGCCALRVAKATTKPKTGRTTERSLIAAVCGDELRRDKLRYSCPMILKMLELVSIVLSALVGGMYWGPWLALSRSLKTFNPEVFLAVVDRLNQNMAGLMTILTPLSLLSILPVLALSYARQPVTFFLYLAGFFCFLIALLVTVLIEVPIVKQIVTWTVQALPHNWEQLRDRWGALHVVRVVAGIAGLGFLVGGAIF